MHGIRFKKGDLIKLRRNHDERENLGIVVEVLVRSPANEDWDQYLILSQSGNLIKKTGRQILSR
tara:strand:- start:52 stop:243 length:192 start_codon:yes stop_codon:yes gene_type:complete